MIDTGAAKNYIRDLDLLKGVKLIDKPFTIKSVHGNSRITSRCLVSLFNRTTTFYILPELKTFDAIVGFDFLREIKAQIDCREGTLTHENGKEKLKFFHCQGVNSIQVNQANCGASPHIFRKLLGLLEENRNVFADPNEALPFNTTVRATINTENDEPVVLISI